MRNDEVILSDPMDIPGVRHMTVGVGFSLSGKVQVRVIEGKKVVREYPEQKNLILNFGMDLIATTTFEACFSRAVLGTGTTPTVDDSGVSQISQATTTVTITGGAFTFTDTATDAGKMVKWDTGEEARIVTVLTSLTATVANSATVVAGEFKVYRTNQTGLATETKRSSTYLTGSANCGTTATGNSFAMKRTYDFTAEVGSVTYNEVGLSSTSSAGNNLFSRILLGAGVSLVSGQAVRLVYTLTLVLEPDTPTTVAASPITGWAGATGVTQIQSRMFVPVNTSGTGGDATFLTSSVCEPFSIGGVVCVLSAASTAHNTFNSPGPTRTGLTGSPKATTLSSYTALNFYREKTVTFSVSESNVTNIRSICLSDTNDATGNQGFVYIIDSDQTKDNLHTLTFTWRITWTRTLA